MSPATRMYFPLAPDQVVALLADGQLGAGLMAYGVDDETRAADPDGDEELWEYRALQRAAHHLRTHGGPVVVAAADIDHSTVAGAAQNLAGAQSIDVPLLRTDVASLHLGDDVLLGQTAAATQQRGSDLHDPEDVGPDAHEDEQIDLSWFDTTELAHVVRYLSPPEETTTWTQ